jgi:hypothetical protein
MSLFLLVEYPHAPTIFVTLATPVNSLTNNEGRVKQLTALDSS